MKRRFKFYEGGLPVFATDEEIARAAVADGTVRTPEEFLKQKGAVRVYDGFLNEFQIEARLSLVRGETRSDVEVLSESAANVVRQLSDLSQVASQEEHFAKRRAILHDLGDIIRSAARISDTLGVSLSEVAERAVRGS
jgi:hypothetical protein